MRRLSLATSAIVAIAFGLLLLGATSQEGNQESAPLESTQVNIERRDPAIDKIVPKDAKLERIASGFKWVEGPIWLKGSLYFAEIPSDSIRKWTPGNDQVSMFITPSGYEGHTPYGGPEPGSNGMTADVHGRLTVAGHAKRVIYRLEDLTPESQLTILASTYKGKKLNSPNDLVYRSDGSLYFTDPPYGLRTQSDQDPQKQLNVNGVYRIPNALSQPLGAKPRRADLQLLVSDLTRPNGIVFSPDEKYLYVNNSEPKKIWMRYRVQPDGSLTEAKLFYDATNDQRPGSPDGMKVDINGNLYSTGPGGVWIFSPEGKPLGIILLSEKSANVAWGGTDRRTLYITASSSIYRVRLSIPGAPLVRNK
ncbi:MAG: SMP-30/gluconolactonase/LRE family protein [Acidobacteria bacterium]|nr:SMP-30/gluconolactonase/LRE family protein [Acidobacteriota bacterium]